MKRSSKALKNKISTNPFAIIVLVSLILYTVLLITPTLWMLLSSLKSDLDFFLNKLGVPEKLMFSNYSTAFKKMYIDVIAGNSTERVYMERMFFNSLLYALGCTVTNIITPCITAYCVAKYRFRLGKVIYAAVIVTMLMPIVGNLPSELQVTKALGVYDNILGLYIMKGNFLGLNFLIMYATFKSLSWDYAEAALIDGASHFVILFKVMIPLVMPTMAALGLLAFIGFWNDYQTPMIYLPSMPTLAYGLWRYQFSTDNAINTVPMQLAGCTIVMFPIFVLFIAFKNKLIGNISVGGLKG